VTLALLALVLTQTPEETNAPRPELVPAAVSVDAMREAMHTYVRGERRSIIPFSLMAFSTLVAGTLLLIPNEPIPRGAAWPLLGFGVLELAAGLFFGLRDEQPKLDALLDEDPDAFAKHEREKVGRISSRNQPVLLAIWSVVMASGGALAGIGATQRLPTLEGVGIGLAIQGLAFFLIDWAVLDRADDYLAVLRHFR
jgi:hypothetical protein